MPTLPKTNTIEALDVPLSELYELRRSGSNTISFPDVDRHLATRPDYIIWRLTRQRQPTAILALPDGVGGGTELLHRNLTRAANSADPSIKWTAYGLVALAMLRMTQVEERLRFVRMPSKLTHEGIPSGDRVGNADLENILKWIQLRQKKFKSAMVHVPDNPLRANRKQTLSREHLTHTEQLLLLALGQISIYLVSTVLNPDTETLAVDTLHDVESLLDAANGGWRPGQAVFVQNLQHYRAGYGRNRFSSCYLPFDFFDYDDWVAAAIGRLVQNLKSVSDHAKLRLSFSGIQHREWLFEHKKDKAKIAEGRALRITIDHTFTYAIGAQRMVIAGGLAARYLAINNLLGWTAGGDAGKCLLRGRAFKPIAKISGCLIEGAAAQLDFSELSRLHKPGETEFQAAPEEYRRLFRRAHRRASNGDVADSSPKESDETSPENIDLQKVALALRWQIEPGNLSRKRLSVLKAAVICLTPDKGQNSEDLARLLDVDTHAFRAFMDASLVSGVAALAEQLQINRRLTSSVFSRAVHVTEFAALLLEWLERPYMADMDIRASWQRQLWQVYAALGDEEKKSMSLDDKLLIFAAVSHVTAAAMKSLGETQADQLEQTIYEESAGSDASFRVARARSDLRVSADELSKMLEQQERRGRCRTAFVQIVLSPDARLATIILAKRGNNTIVHREADIEFVRETHQELHYESWSDISAEVVAHDYFNNQTQLLHEYYESPLGRRSVHDLWQRIVSILSEMDAAGLPGHIWIAPDGVLANIPWQLVAMKEDARPDDFPIVTLVHGLRWVFLSAHVPEASPELQRLHGRGIQAWISSAPTPRPDLDIRGDVKAAFYGADNNCPAMADRRGVSLSVVFGHGAVTEDAPIALTEAIKDPRDWYDVRDSRICLLLSCYTGIGKPGALGDYVSISHKLSRSSKALIAPPIEVPHTAVLTLAAVFNEAFSHSLGEHSWRIQEVYREAIRRDPAVALFSLWGLGYEPLVWKTQWMSAVMV